MTTIMRLADWLNQAVLTLAPLQAADPHVTDLRFEAIRLWADLFDKNPAAVAAYLTEPLQNAEIATLDAALLRRARGEPLAYITGRWWFWDIELKVAPCTLIPRPDTELLVETALALDLPKDAAVLDLGTGTGAIALVLARQRSQWQVTGVDFAPAAVALAGENASRLQVNNVQFFASDWFSALGGKQYALIVSNPPYIDDADPHLQQGDVRFEPASALVAAQNGLADIQRIVTAAPNHLLPGGWLWLEHGHQQHSAVQQILVAAGFQAVESRRDYGHNWRISGGRWPG